MLLFLEWSCSKISNQNHRFVVFRISPFSLTYFFLQEFRFFQEIYKFNSLNNSKEYIKLFRDSQRRFFVRIFGRNNNLEQRFLFFLSLFFIIRLVLLALIPDVDWNGDENRRISADTRALSAASPILRHSATGWSISAERNRSLLFPVPGDSI